MSVSQIGSYHKKVSTEPGEGYAMYDLAKTIQQDRRRHACAQRMISEQARRRSNPFGLPRVMAHRRTRTEVIGG
jgi:hypothetical protein